MLSFKSNKIILAACFCILSALLFPTLAQAELGGSGSTAARDAAEQRAAKERKLEKKRLAEEAKKAAEGQQSAPTEATQQPPAAEPEKPAAQ